jgi:SAM-dependent methyltransferase
MIRKQEYDLETYPFEPNDFLFYFRSLYHDRGIKAFYQLFNRTRRRPYSRGLIARFAPTGIGLEIGVGARTICPTTRTVLSDGYSEHGVANSIAKVFFMGDEIPYKDETFSFVLSEHVLEHIANPIKMLKEWIRVLKKNGHVFLFLPHKERTFDRFRKITTLEHLISDYENDISFDDQGHLKEWWQDIVEKGLMPDHYKHIGKQDVTGTGSIHHHVWTEKEIAELLEYVELKVVLIDPKVHDRRDTFVVVGRKI